MKMAVFTVLFVLVLVVAWLFLLAFMSRSGVPLGLKEGRLAPCPDTPNCVCSEVPLSSSAFVEAVEISGYGAEEAWQIVKRVVVEEGGQLQVEDTSYLAATFASKLFGFVDDLELRLDAEHQVIHLRSASRVGHSDMGANRERVARLKARMENYR